MSGGTFSGLALTLGTVASPAPVGNLSAFFGTETVRSCAATEVSNQNIACPIAAFNCSNVQVICNNSATQTFVCDLTGAANIANTVIATEPLSAVATAVGLPKSATQAAITAKITNNIQQLCTENQSSDQAILADIVCTAAENIDLNVVNNMSENAACTTGYILKVIEQARANAAKTHNANQMLVIVVVGVVLAVVWLGICYAAFVGVRDDSVQGRRGIYRYE
jgi:hypothetical protein